MLRSAFNQKYPLSGALYFILILGDYSWEGVGTKKIAIHLPNIYEKLPCKCK